MTISSRKSPTAALQAGAAWAEWLASLTASEIEAGANHDTHRAFNAAYVAALAEAEAELSEYPHNELLAARKAQREAEAERDRQAAMVVAFREALLEHAKCSVCRGTGKVWSRCTDPQHHDPTWDHDCDKRPTPCAYCDHGYRQGVTAVLVEVDVALTKRGRTLP